MSSTQTVLRIVVASPDDVQPERNAVRDIATKINAVGLPGVHLRVEGWEDLSPQMGHHPQDIINTRLVRDCDILICILWGRVGTPTRTSDSGTLEEYRLAVKSYEEQGFPKVMLYFKEQGISPSDIDPQQIEKVKEFRKSQRESGLYRTFSTTDDFKEKLHSHLQLVCIQGMAIPVDKQEAAGDSTEIEVQEDDRGLLDYKDIQETSFQQVMEIVTRLGSGMTDITKALKVRTVEMQNINEVANGNVSDADMRRICTLMANDLNLYSSRVMAEIVPFREYFNSGVNAFVQVVRLSTTGKPMEIVASEVQRCTNELKGMQDSLVGGKNSIAGFRNSAGQLPSIEASLNRAKRETVRSLDLLLDEMSSASVLIDAAIQSLQESSL